MDTDPDRIAKLRGRLEYLEEVWTAGGKSVEKQFQGFQGADKSQVLFLFGRLAETFETWMETTWKLIKNYKEYIRELERLIPK